MHPLDVRPFAAADRRKPGQHLHRFSLHMAAIITLTTNGSFDAMMHS
jgi:hypothetical protein